jgi:hypothetical protein
MRELLRAGLALSMLCASPQSCRPTERPPEAGPVHIYPSLEDHREMRDAAFEYGVVYLLLPWRQWEVERDGKITFAREVLDDALRSAGGRQLAIRFQVINEGCPIEKPTWMSPSWLRTERCEKKECPGAELWTLDWSQPAAQQRHAAALAALGEWVREHEQKVAWVELGSYGFYGEWHYSGCEGLGDVGTGAEKRAHMARVATDYACAFPRTPLTTAFDALKLPDGMDPASDPLRARLKTMKSGLYFDALGDDDVDFTKHVDAKLAADFAGPFLGEFKGDDGIPNGPKDEEPCGPNDAGATFVLNERSDACWQQTIALLRDFRFLLIRQGGANALSRERFQRDLKQRGQTRFRQLIEVLQQNRAEPGQMERLEWLKAPRECKASPELERHQP